MTRIYSTAEVQAVGAAWAIDPAIGAKVERALGHETTPAGEPPTAPAVHEAWQHVQTCRIWDREIGQWLEPCRLAFPEDMTGWPCPRCRHLAERLRHPDA
jgi:hypothetical protein